MKVAREGIVFIVIAWLLALGAHLRWASRVTRSAGTSPRCRS